MAKRRSISVCEAWGRSASRWEATAKVKLASRRGRNGGWADCLVNAVAGRSGETVADSEVISVGMENLTAVALESK